MADPNILAFNCLNPECGKLIKLRRPAKSGIYPVTCPHCKVQKKLNIKGLDVFKEASEASGTAKSEESVLDNSSKSVITLHDDFLVGETYRFMCPHCGKQEIGLTSNKAGIKEFLCPLCKGKITVNVRLKTQVLSFEDETRQLIKGKLVLLRKGWLNKDYPLGLGKHVIGRYDESEMSDISIKNDNAMSRRSIRIDVDQTEKGFAFKLTVLKATNPVLHNNSPLANGESVSLNFGDTIMLGKTKFRFDKDL